MVKSKFFNHDIKMEFLSDYDDITRKTYERVLNACTPFEKQQKKDVCEFTTAQMEPIFRSMKPTTISAAQSIVSVVANYIQYCIDKGIKKKNKVNQLGNLNREFFKPLIEKDLKLYYTEKEIQRIVNLLRNSQDSSIVLMVFNGVQGQGSSEVVNLKKWDVDEEGHKLKLTEADGSTRILEVGEECIEEVLQASKQTEYLLKNGQVGEGSRRSTTNLNVSDYVIRNSVTNLEKQNEAADKHTAYRRLKMISEVFDLKHFTVKNVSRSGMLAMGRKFLKEFGELTEEHYEKIAEQFRFNNVQQLKTIVNESTIKELYGEEF